MKPFDWLKLWPYQVKGDKNPFRGDWAAHKSMAVMAFRDKDLSGMNEHLMDAEIALAKERNWDLLNGICDDKGMK